MRFRRSDLQEVFFVPETHAFRVYGYGTGDPLEEVLAPGYFAHGTGLLRPGDLVYVSSCPAQAPGGAVPGEPRMALVMARPEFATGKGLKLRVSIEVRPDEGLSSYEIEVTELALRELGLAENIEISPN